MNVALKKINKANIWLSKETNKIDETFSKMDGMGWGGSQITNVGSLKMNTTVELETLKKKHSEDNMSKNNFDNMDKID